MARRRLFALVLCSALALAACSKDPVLADLAAMDQVGQTAFKDNSKINALMQQASASKSQEEQSRLLGEVGQEMMRKAKAMEAFTAQTPEVGKIHSDLTTAMKDAAQGAIDSQAAFDRKDAPALHQAQSRLNEAMGRLQTAAQAYAQLAKDKGYQFKK